MSKKVTKKLIGCENSPPEELLRLRKKNVNSTPECAESQTNILQASFASKFLTHRAATFLMPRAQGYRSRMFVLIYKNFRPTSAHDSNAGGLKTVKLAQ